MVEEQQRQKVGQSFSGLIFARQSRGAIGRYIQDLEVIAQIGEPEDFLDRVEFLPL